MSWFGWTAWVWSTILGARPPGVANMICREVKSRTWKRLGAPLAAIVAVGLTAAPGATPGLAASPASGPVVTTQAASGPGAGTGGFLDEDWGDDDTREDEKASKATGTWQSDHDLGSVFNAAKLVRSSRCLWKDRRSWREDHGPRHRRGADRHRRLPRSQGLTSTPARSSTVPTCRSSPRPPNPAPRRLRPRHPHGRHHRRPRPRGRRTATRTTRPLHRRRARTRASST